MIGRLVAWGRRHPVLALCILACLAIACLWVALWAPRVGGVGALALIAGGAASIRRSTIPGPPPSQPEQAAAEAQKAQVETDHARDRAEDAAVQHRAKQAAHRARETAAAEPVSAPRPRSKYLGRRP